MSSRFGSRLTELDFAHDSVECPCGTGGIALDVCVSSWPTYDLQVRVLYLKIHLWRFMTFQNGVVFSCFFVVCFFAAFPAFAFVAFRASAFTAFCCLCCFCIIISILNLILILSFINNIDNNNNDDNNNTKIQNNQWHHQDSTAMRAFWGCNYRTTPQPPLQLVQAKPSPNHFESPRTAAHPSKTPGTKALKKQSINLDPPEWNDMDGICLIRFQAIHFSHPFARYRKMQDGQAGRILEINELLEWPSESNPCQRWRW